MQNLFNDDAPQQPVAQTTSLAMTTLMKGFQLVKNYTIPALNSTIALTTGATFWYFASQSAAELLPALGLPAGQETLVKQLGLSLLTAGGTYLSLKLKPIKELQKKIIKTTATKAICLFIPKSNSHLPLRPAEFASPEEEANFNQEKELAEMMKDMSATFVSLGVDFAVDALYGDHPAIFNPGSNDTPLFADNEDSFEDELENSSINEAPELSHENVWVFRPDNVVVFHPNTEARPTRPTKKESRSPDVKPTHTYNLRPRKQKR